MKIFGCFLLTSFTFSLYLGTSWKECSEAVKIAYESVAIQTGCRKDGNKIKRTSWTEPLKTESKNFCWSRLWKYLQNICVFGMSNSQWRAAGRNLLFSSFFSKQDLKFLYAKFLAPLTSPSGFLPTNVMFCPFFPGKNISSKILVVFSPFKKIFTCFRSKISAKLIFTFGNFWSP